MKKVNSHTRIFYKRLLLLEWNRRTVFYISIWLFTVGLGTLVLRMLFVPNIKLLINILIVGTVLLTLFSFKIARRSIPSFTKLNAYLDSYNGCGGLLLAKDEVRIGSWFNDIPALSQPELQWDYKRPVLILVSSVIFCVFSFLSPVSSLISQNKVLDIADEVNSLENQIDVLKDEEIIEEEDAVKLKDELERLQNSAVAVDPIKTWESLDNMNRNLQQKASEFTENSIKQQEQISNIESLAELLSSEQAESLDASTMTDAMRELSKMMKESMEQSRRLKNFISDDLIKAIKAGNLSPKDLKMLKQSLAQSQKAVQDSIMKMIQNKMIDPRSMKISKQARKKSMQKLSEYLRKNCGNKKMCKRLSQCMRPGRGGVGRGRADADMNYLGESNTTGAKFKPVVLPPAQMADLRSSYQFGTSYTAPNTDGAELSKSGALTGVKVDGGAGYKHTLLPKHKKIIKEYFNRERSNE